eukprot:JZ548379.1.p1 GENE.JZ548379.1~~JZ548379.1.p1  ORF type:complete len:186 (+),score=24.23 JZ548379.1:36-593(+)
MPVWKRRIAVMGSVAVGKSSVTVRFVEDRFVQEYSPTIETTIRKQFKIGNQEYELELIDTAGMDDTSFLPSSLTMGIHGYVLVFSLAQAHTFRGLSLLNDKILNAVGTDSVPRVIVGNKNDLPDAHRQVDKAEIERLAQEWKCPYVECSAKTGARVDEVFTKLLIEIDRQLNPQAQKSGGGCVML